MLLYSDWDVLTFLYQSTVLDIWDVDTDCICFRVLQNDTTPVQLALDAGGCLGSCIWPHCEVWILRAAHQWIMGNEEILFCYELNFIVRNNILGSASKAVITESYDSPSMSYMSLTSQAGEGGSSGSSRPVIRSLQSATAQESVKIPVFLQLDRGDKLLLGLEFSLSPIQGFCWGHRTTTWSHCVWQEDVGRGESITVKDREKDWQRCRNEKRNTAGQ